MNFEDGKIKQRPLVYLAGAITAAADKGSRWRFEITPHLHSLGYDTFNPLIEQPILSGVTREELDRLKKEDVFLYQEACQKIVQTDLNVLTKSNAVVCKLDVFSAGTYGELTVAKILNIPIFAWIDLEGGLVSLPNWVAGCIDHYSLHELDFYKLIPSAIAFDQHSTFKNYLD